MSSKLLHATCVALPGPGGPLGVLLRGSSGTGKSDLALRLIDRGARLVADDQCEVTVEGSSGEDRAAGPRLIARAPVATAGLLEVRGLGIAEVPTLAQAPIALLVDLVARDEVERLPDRASEAILDVDLPRLALDPFEAAAPAKLDLALRWAVADSLTSDSVPSSKPGETRPVVLVTGLSGAGRSTALKILEDLGYEAIDNLPLELLGSMDLEGGPIALGIDIRSRSFAAGALIDRIDRLGADARTTILFLDCDDEVLERRFTETRRPHPLAADRRVADGIAAERRLIAPLRERADITVDTTSLNGAELRRLLAGHLGLGKGPGMKIFVTSFSYRGGLPREADLVFDARFLANPHYEPALRPLDGRDPRVADYVARDPAHAAFFEGLTGMLAPLLPRYEREGKSYLTIALGCTGGRHRSVAVAERLAAWIAGIGRPVELAHRELGPGGVTGGAPRSAPGPAGPP
jgi:RNase adaptor protein for sRNA GlmZ degradation